jgi:tRNA dimethylallyltransferase
VIKIVSIVGLTASGKSAIGIKVAKEFNGEIISADSRQVYRGLDIGTAKVTREEQKMVRHHLIDIAEPGEKFDVFEFQKRAYAAIEDIAARGKLPILVGGTGLYSRAVVEGYEWGREGGGSGAFVTRHDVEKRECFSRLVLGCRLRNVALTEAPEPPAADAQLFKKHPAAAAPPPRPENPAAPRFEVLQVCLMPPKEFVRAGVERRIEERLRGGMIEETRGLLDRGVSAEWLLGLGLEYYWNVRFLRGEVDLEAYKEGLLTKTMQFAKRQRTWFKRERNTVFLSEPGEFYDCTMKLIKRFLI